MQKDYRLANGARVFLVPLKSTKSITTMVMYPVGSRYEKEGLRGVSHFVEHLMFKGTKKRPSTLALTKEIDRLGAGYNAFTGKEYTGYYIKADASSIDVSLDILSDMLFESLYDPEEMEKEKKVIVEELRMYKDNPIMNIDNIFEELMFEGCDLGQDIGGTEESVLSFPREDVLAYRDKHYGAANMNIVLAGNLPEDIEARIESYFGNRPAGETNIPFSPSAFGSNESRIKVMKKETDQVQLMVGVPGISMASSERHIAKVLNKILGGSMSSRLFIKVRERMGLAYSVHSGAEYYRDNGYLYVSAGLEAANINKAIEAIWDEIESIKKEGVTDQEIADAKTNVKGGLVLSLENSSSVADWYAKDITLEESVVSPEEWADMIDSVTKEEVQAFANKYYHKDQLRVAIIGNVDEKDVTF